MKKIFLFILVFLTNISFVLANLQNSMIPTENTVLGNTSGGLNPLNAVLIYSKNFIFGILGLLVIGVFLYFGFKLITAKGNAEELKKALMGFVYVVVGLAVMSLAWAVVKLVTTLNF